MLVSNTSHDPDHQGPDDRIAAKPHPSILSMRPVHPSPNGNPPKSDAFRDAPSMSTAGVRTDRLYLMAAPNRAGPPILDDPILRIGMS